MSWETFQFGQLYLDGKPQDIPTISTKNNRVIPAYKSGQEIDIMGASNEHSITWIKPDGMNLFVADRALLGNVSWKGLKTAGFVDGKTVDIGGKRYRCRLLQVGSKKGAVNEWDSILDATSEDNDLWHWESMFFWGTDTITDWAENRAIRGSHLARDWWNCNATYRGSDVGFRPALEPLPFDIFSPGNKILVLDGQHVVLSQLQGLTKKVFYPQLSPAEVNLFIGIPDGSKMSMYTLLCNGAPVCQAGEAVPNISQAEGITLAITDVFYEDKYLIPWTISNGVAVADRPILAGVDMNNAIVLDS